MCGLGYKFVEPIFVTTGQIRGNFGLMIPCTCVAGGRVHLRWYSREIQGGCGFAHRREACHIWSCRAHYASHHAAWQLNVIPLSHLLCDNFSASVFLPAAWL